MQIARLHIVNMGLRQYLAVFCLLLLVTLGNSSGMEYVIFRRLNALETKFETENKLRRTESEELLRMISDLAEYRATDAFANHCKLKSYIIKGVTVEKQQNAKLRSELKDISKQLKTDYTMFEIKIKEDIKKFTNHVSEKISNLVSEDNFNNLSDFMNTRHLELRNEVEQSMISLTSDVEKSNQNLHNDFQILNQTATKNAELCNNVSDSLTMVTNERLNNLRDFVNDRQSELRNETKQSLIALKSDVETTIQKLSSDLLTVNQTAMNNVERFNNVSDLLTKETNERLNNLSADYHNLKTYITKGVATEKQQTVKLRSELKSISKQLKADYGIFEYRIKEEIRNFTNDVSDKLTLLVYEERFDNLSDFVRTTQSELRNETRKSLMTLNSDTEVTYQKLSSDLQTLNQTSMENVERYNNVIDFLTIVTSELFSNLTALVTTTHSETRNETRQSMISLKSDVETSIQKLSNDLQTVNQTTTENVERCKNVSNTLTILTNERLNNLTALVTMTHSELKKETRQSIISTESKMETSIQKLSKDMQIVNQTAMENEKRCNNVSNTLTIETNERLNNLTVFVTTTHSEFRNETIQSIISFKSEMETSIQKLSNDLQTVNKTAIENVERCNNVSNTLTILTNEQLNNLTAFVTTTQSEFINESRQSTISLMSVVESSIQKLSSDLRTVNQTAMKNVERFNNVNDSLTRSANECLNNLTAFVSTRQTELQTEARQSLILLKSDVESSILKLSIDLRTLNQTALKNVESCKNVSDSTAKLTNERLNNLSAFVTLNLTELRNETRQSLISLKSDVETSVQKLSSVIHTVNQTAMKNAECCNNVSTTTEIRTNNTIYIGSCKNAPKSNGNYYLIYTKSATPLRVYCDQETDGGGWLVIQRRKDGSVDFYRNWTDYKTGFGDIENEFWLGNDNIHALTSLGLNELRIDMMDFEGNKAYAKYSNFKVHPESDLYKLKVGGYSGNASDSFGYLNGEAFSTKDRDNDKAWNSCSEVNRGAWWYRGCGPSNLNGLYYHGGNSHGDGIYWYYWKGWYYSLKTVEMKIR